MMLLLAFFIMLFAVSEREPSRARDVLGSFNQRSIGTTGPVTIVPVAGDVPAMKVIERRWLDLFPGAAVEHGVLFGNGSLLVAALDAEAMFADGPDRPARGAEATLAALARLVGDAPADVALSLEIRFGLGDDARAEDLPVAIRRAGALARLLPPEIAVGVERGKPGMAALQLRLTPRPLVPRPLGPTVPARGGANAA